MTETKLLLDFKRAQKAHHRLAQLRAAKGKKDLPPEFLKNIKKKDDDKGDDKDDDKDKKAAGRVGPGMKFKDQYGVWMVDQKAKGTTSMWEIWLTSRGKGHAKVEDESALLQYYTKVAAGPRGKKTARNAGHDIMMVLAPNLSKVYGKALKEDEQTAKLLRELMMAFMDEFDLDTGKENALSRLQTISEAGARWDISLLRNNVFKAADSFGLSLPSGMFASRKRLAQLRAAKGKKDLPPEFLKNIKKKDDDKDDDEGKKGKKGKKGAIIPFEFYDEAIDLRNSLQKQKDNEVEKLVLKASAALQKYGFKVTHSASSTWPRRGFFLASLVIKGEDELEKHEFEDLITDILGDGWEVGKRGPDWFIEVEVEGF
jgi:hypothetical protein